MVVAGNFNYRNEGDLPDEVPVFPLEGALLLPAAQMPLNIFEPRYIAMIDDAMRSNRVIGMVQPSFDGRLDEAGEPTLCRVGCLGRITALTEAGNGRYLINLHGIVRFRVLEEIDSALTYRRCRVSPFLGDLDLEEEAETVDRDALLKTFRLYLDVNQLEADWESVAKASNETLVNALCMMSPYGAAEKQALLEAANLKLRSETLIAIAEVLLARGSLEDSGGLRLQ